MHSVIIFFLMFFITSVESQFIDICGLNNGKRFYLERGESGSLVADYQNNVWNHSLKNTSISQKCTVEFITCPSCIIDIKFRYLNISRNCEKASIFDTCGCHYVWIYEPPVEDGSGEQFCGRFVQNNVSDLSYTSQTRTVALAIIYSSEYGYAFALDYSSKRNRIQLKGNPKIGSQYISSPFFPYLYPIDLSVEYVINCESLNPCRISLIFTDFLIADSSIIEFFDWNGQRMYVTSGNIFRPPTIISTGPSLVIRFYANGASNFGFKAAYSYILGNINDLAFTPNIGCGGFVNNLGGAITMMNMIAEGTTFFDCVWIIKPPEILLHRKTHLYVKIVNFTDFDGGLIPKKEKRLHVNLGLIQNNSKICWPVNFLYFCWLAGLQAHSNILELFWTNPCNLHKVLRKAMASFTGTTELVIRQGLTSNQPAVEILKHPMAHFSLSKQMEHVVPITKGFYVRLRGHFGAQSQLAIVFAAFNYKDCFATSDFLCHNLRCISTLLNCDGFDHCGDNSDESSDCSLDPKDHREFSKIPNFLFPKMEPYSDITTATFVFLSCSFGLISIMLAMALLLHKINVRARQQRQIQDHLETIHAILEEGVGDVEEEIIVPDDPPDYEAPPDYEDVLKLKYVKKIEAVKFHNKSTSTFQSSSGKTRTSQPDVTTSKEHLTNGDCSSSLPTTSKSCQCTPIKIPDSPPPSYDNIKNHNMETMKLSSSGLPSKLVNTSIATHLSGPSNVSLDLSEPNCSHFKTASFEEKATSYSMQIFSEIRKSVTYCKSMNFLKQARKMISFSEEDLVRYFSDSELVFDSNVNINCITKSRRSKLKKSFSTDDISFYN